MKTSNVAILFLCVILLVIVSILVPLMMASKPLSPSTTASEKAMSYIEGRQASDDTVYLEYETKRCFLKISSMEDTSISFRSISEEEFKTHLKKMLIRDNWVIRTNENCKFGEEKTQTKFLAVSRHFPKESIPELLQITGFLPTTDATTRPATQPASN